MGASPLGLTWGQVLSWRMDRQFLDRREDVDTAGVVRRLAGVQAQVASSAEQAVAVRRPSATGDVAGALADRVIVKTWAQRGTLHVLAADDAAAYLSLLAAARTWEKGAWQREFATADQMAAIAEAAAEVLDGAVLTREELVSEILARVGDPTLAEKLGSGWGAVLKPLAWQGLLCNGISHGNRVTFTSPATWLPTWKGLPEPEDAAAVVIPAYLGAHGPASPACFDQWLHRGATKKATLRSWFAALAENGVLAEADVDGERLYARVADLDALSAAEPTQRVRLLPAFDQYVLGPGTKDHHVIAPARRSLISKAAGWISPVVVAGSRVAGTWQADGDALAVELFGESEPVDRSALDAEIAVLEHVLGRQLTASVGTI
ncbi:MAG: winged helix DNA-binding domain-containing protein [Streptosporangiales bacterium]|nr:winged helix DNA-binding domain-containing protein [Streptosporangiales bacterium]